MNKFLASVYYDPKSPAGFSTVTKLYNASKRAGKSYSRVDIEKWLRSQDTYTLYKPQRKNFPTRRVKVLGIDEVHQGDLADMSKHATHNDGVKFLLCLIDVFSKMAWVLPLKNKSNVEIVQAFDTLYADEMARVPLKLGTDSGKEFVGKSVREVFKKYGIHHYTLGNRQKAAVAERFVRTLKTKLHKLMDSRGSEKYIDELQNVVTAYNATIHRSIKRRPIDVSYANAGKVYKTLYPKENKTPKPKYKTGDLVRISEYKRTFDKGYEQNWTHEVFTVKRVLNTNPITYTLKDYYDENVDGTFYEPELCKVIIPADKVYRIDYVIKEQGKGKNKRWLIKYQGYRKPEWSAIPPDDIYTRRSKE